MVATIRPVSYLVAKPMVDRVTVDIGNDSGEVSVGSDWFLFEIGHEEAATAGVLFIKGFGITIEKVREGLSDDFRRLRIQTSKVSENLGGFSPNQEMKMIRHQTISISHSHWFDVFCPLSQEVMIVLLFSEEVFIAVDVIVDMVVRRGLH